MLQRRWFRRILICAFMAMIVLAPPLFYLQRAAKIKQVCLKIEGMGGKISYEPTTTFVRFMAVKNWIRKSFAGKLGEAAWVSIVPWEALREMSIILPAEGMLSSEDWNILAKSGLVLGLNAQETDLSEGQFAGISKLTSLQTFTTRQFPRDLKTLEEISEFSNLRSLTIRNIRQPVFLNADQLRCLGKLPAIKAIQSIAIADSTPVANTFGSTPKSRSILLENTLLSSEILQEAGRIYQLGLLSLQNCRTAEEKKCEACEFKNLQKLICIHSKLSSEFLMDLLSKNPTINELWIKDSTVPSDVLDQISKLPSLILLDLTGSQLSPFHPTSQSFPSLTQLNLTGCQGEERVFKQLLKNSPSLQALNLSKTPVRDGILPEIDALESLRDLDVQETRISGAIVPLINRHTNWLSINLWKSGVTDKDLAKIKNPKFDTRTRFLRTWTP